MNLSTEKKIMDLENRLVVAWGEGEGGGWMGNLGLMDADYCLQNGLAMRIYCVALRTMSRYLQRSTTMGEKIMYICMCNWVPMLYSGKKKCGGHLCFLFTVRFLERDCLERECSQKPGGNCIAYSNLRSTQ